MKKIGIAIVTMIAWTLVSSPARANVTLGPAVVPLEAGHVSLVWQASETSPMAVTLVSPGRPDHAAMSNIVNGIHRLHFRGLEPGAEYSYRIGCRTWGKFLSPPNAAQAVRFGVFGDTRGGDKTHTLLVHSLAQARPDFYLITGDILADGDATAAWQNFFTLEKPLTSTTAFTGVRGNHDGESSVFGQFLTPRLSSDPSDQSYGSMSLGPAHFVMVDSEQSVAPGSPQYHFIELDLAAHRTEPLFVLLHKPLFSTGTHGGNSKIQSALAPLFQRYGVDLVLQGHDHLYERSMPINGVTYIVTGGGGAPLYGAASADWVEVHESANHYLLIDTSASRIRTVVKRLDGSTLDVFDIDPRANNKGVQVTAKALPSPGGGGCATLFVRPRSFRRNRSLGLTASSFGSTAIFAALRSRRRQRKTKSN